MQDQTGNTTGDGNDTVEFEAEVSSAVGAGDDVQELVKRLTLRAISAHSLDSASLGLIIRAVLRGARAGAQQELHQSAAQIEITRGRLTQAVAGLDAALAQFVAASTLALKEAAGRARQFSHEDLTRAYTDLGALEALFLDSLQRSASSGKDVAEEILADLAAHARIHGSAVGAQLKEALVVVGKQGYEAGRTQAGAGLHLAEATSDLLRQITAGVLSGLADRVKPSHRPASESD
ncbi:MAG TPA: DUF6781 family protein [Gemmatimonadaceae bacterium]|jgi:hypothetical protein